MKKIDSLCWEGKRYSQDYGAKVWTVPSRLSVPLYTSLLLLGCPPHAFTRGTQHPSLANASVHLPNPQTGLVNAHLLNT